MSKTLKSIQKTVLSLALIVLCSVSLSTVAKAEWVTDRANGVNYDNKKTGIGVGYAWSYGSSDTVTVRLDKAGDRVTNVRSNSSNLIAQKVYEYTQKNNYNSSATTSYPECYIGVFAKKAGKYTVSFDVVDASGNLKCTKTIAVSTNSKTYKSGILSIKYAGKDAYSYYPYTNVKSGKLSVKMKKGYKLISIERGSYDATGKYVTTPVKNNSKIKLVTKVAYKGDYSYNSSGTISGYIYQHDRLFPNTEIIVKYMNSKTKEEFTEGVTLYTINKKNTLMKP